MPDSVVVKMREKILAVINEMKFASADEISSVLGGVKPGSLTKEIENLEQARVVFRVLPSENSASLEGFIAGPRFEAEEDVEIKKLLVDNGVSNRTLSIIEWKPLAQRKLTEVQNDLEGLLDDITKKEEDSKKLELRYFELCIRYHELYRFLSEKDETALLTLVNKTLEKCRQYLDKLEY